jgi:hypothetical protein
MSGETVYRITEGWVIETPCFIYHSAYFDFVFLESIALRTRMPYKSLII